MSGPTMRCGACGRDFTVEEFFEHHCEAFAQPGDRILYEPGCDTVDEIVCHGVDIHVEVMSDDNIWMGVTRGDQRLMVNFGKRTRCAPITYFVEDDGETPWRWEREHEHPAPDDPPVLKDLS